MSALGISPVHPGLTSPGFISTESAASSSTAGEDSLCLLLSNERIRIVITVLLSQLSNYICCAAVLMAKISTTANTQLNISQTTNTNRHD